MVRTANWLDENVEQGTLIAVHDIGAIGYYAELPILDLAGLISPDVIPFIRDEVKLAEYINEQGAEYLVTFPDWYPDLVKQGELVFDTEGEFAESEGGQNMQVFRWQGEE